MRNPAARPAIERCHAQPPADPLLDRRDAFRGSLATIPFVIGKAEATTNQRHCEEKETTSRFHPVICIDPNELARAAATGA